MNNISFENLKNIQKSAIGMFMQVVHKEFCLYSIDFLNKELNSSSEMHIEIPLDVLSQKLDLYREHTSFPASMQDDRFVRDDATDILHTLANSPYMLISILESSDYGEKVRLAENFYFYTNQFASACLPSKQTKQSLIGSTTGIPSKIEDLHDSLYRTKETRIKQIDSMISALQKEKEELLAGGELKTFSEDDFQCSYENIRQELSKLLSSARRASEEYLRVSREIQDSWNKKTGGEVVEDCKNMIETQYNLKDNDSLYKRISDILYPEQDYSRLRSLLQETEKKPEIKKILGYSNKASLMLDTLNNMLFGFHDITLRLVSKLNDLIYVRSSSNSYHGRLKICNEILYPSSYTLHEEERKYINQNEKLLYINFPWISEIWSLHSRGLTYKSSERLSSETSEKDDSVFSVPDCPSNIIAPTILSMSKDFINIMGEYNEISLSDFLEKHPIIYGLCEVNILITIAQYKCFDSTQIDGFLDNLPVYDVLSNSSFNIKHFPNYIFREKVISEILLES